MNAVNRKRNRTLSVRMTPEEYDQLSEKIKLSGQTKQNYIINAALTGRISSADEVAVLKEKNHLLEDMDKLLRGMGTNINQMAHVANGQGIIPTAAVLLKMSNDISTARKEVQDLWQSTRRSISQQKPMGQ